MSSDITTCDRCGGAVNASMKFCPACGADLTRAEARRARAALSPAHYALIGAGAVALFAGSLGLRSFIHWKRSEVKPTEVFKQQEQEPTAADTSNLPPDPALDALRAQVAASPEDLAKLRAMASYLSGKLRNNPDAPPSLVFEAIDTLSRILKIAPNDPPALLMMADISFDQRAFGKAIELYQRYLKLVPDDLGAQARYASTLTFIGRYDDSIKELEGVLARDPKNFPAIAYLAITYAQKGDKVKAKEIATTALSIAPTEEARKRFSEFVATLDNPDTKSAPPSESKGDANTTASQPATGIDGLIDAIKANPIAGQKYVRYEEKGADVVYLYFRNFPMQAMPPFAKEKFFGGIRARVKAAGLNQLKKIVFVDADNGTELETMSVEG